MLPSVMQAEPLPIFAPTTPKPYTPGAADEKSLSIVDPPAAPGRRTFAPAYQHRTFSHLSHSTNTASVRKLASDDSHLRPAPHTPPPPQLQLSPTPTHPPPPFPHPPSLPPQHKVTAKCNLNDASRVDPSSPGPLRRGTSPHQSPRGLLFSPSEVVHTTPTKIWNCFRASREMVFGCAGCLSLQSTLYFEHPLSAAPSLGPG